MKMKLRINGKEQDIERQGSLRELAESRHLNCKNIVIEHNLEIIPKNKWKEVSLKEGDSIEIVTFVGGG